MPNFQTGIIRLIIRWCNRKLFMYGMFPRPWQKILGFFLGKPDHIKAEEAMNAFGEGLAQGFADGFAIEIDMSMDKENENAVLLLSESIRNEDA